MLLSSELFFTVSASICRSPCKSLWLSHVKHNFSYKADDVDFSTTSAAVNVALAIELLCQPNISAGEKSVYEEAVRNGIMFLRDVQEIWATVGALLSLFAWVLARKELVFASGLEPLENPDNVLDNTALPFTAFGTPNNPFATSDDDIANALLFGNESYLDLPSWTDEAIFGRL